MKLRKYLLPLVLITGLALVGFAQEKRNSHYITNQAPLLAQPYTALPLGAIRPKGMLLEMLLRQQNGLTGKLDSIYTRVCGPNNGWLGGTGDGWERGPYWIDGLVPLAYMLDDQKLKAKVQAWVEWSINNQQADGYFGPRPLPEGYKKIAGTQQGDREDWWPKMVMLKALQQYYTATGDERVITLMTNYFRYMQQKLPSQPLGHWTYWGAQRGGDNLALVYWLYNITKEKSLLALGDLIHKQSFNWTTVMTDNTIRKVNPLPQLHCVNVAQGLKEPGIYYQKSKDLMHREAPKEGLSALKDVHGFVNGMYGGDEHLHGNNPTQGSELCSAVELMFSFESMLPITGDVFYADYLEKIAYNVLPAQSTDDYMRRQYFQQPNQVLVTNQGRNFFNDNNGHLVFGTTTGYPCCTTNMHQGWPKFVQNLWYATSDNGIAALVYGESEVSMKVAEGQMVTVEEKTSYPFKEDIKFTMGMQKAVKFPFHLRIPQWCSRPVIKINNKEMDVKMNNGVVVIDRIWNNNDEIVLVLPMEFRKSWWYNTSVGIERGPIVYALKIEEEWSEVKRAGFDDTYWEVRPRTPWNYSLMREDIDKLNFPITIKENIDQYPWNLENAPITIKVRGLKVSNWTIVNGQAGMLPSPGGPSEQLNNEVPDTIELVPYGCTTLRISQFPVLK